MADAPKTFEQIAEGVLDSAESGLPTGAADTTVQTQGTTNGQGLQAGSDVQPGNQPAEESAASFKERLASVGFKFGDTDDDAAAQERAIAALEARQQEIEHYKQQVEFARLQREYYETQLRQQGQQHQQATAETQKKIWNPPEVDDQLVRLYAQTGADGELTWRPETPPQLRAAYDARETYRHNWINQLATSPEAALAPYFEQHRADVQKMINDALQTAQAQQQQESVLDTFINQNANWVYQIDPVTNQPKVGYDRQPVLSEAGVKFDRILTEMIDQGLQHDKALEAAQAIYQMRYGSPTQPPQSRKETIAQNRLAHLQNANAAAAARNGHQSAKDAGLLTGAAARSTSKSFEEMFVENLGLAPNS